jgi:hypothetical protein
MNIGFEVTGSIFHNHKYNPKDPHAMRPEGECEACDQIRDEIRERIPADPFEGLG